MVSWTRFARRLATSCMNSGRIRIAVADQERDDQLGVGIQRGPCPGIASTFRGCLAVATLRCLAWTKDQISSHWMRLDLTPRTFSSWNAMQASPAPQQLRHRVDGDVRHAGYRPHGRTFHQHGEDLDALGGAELVHAHVI